LTKIVIFNYSAVVPVKMNMTGQRILNEIQAEWCISAKPSKYRFKSRKARPCGSGFDSEGQLKERSEGDQAQWQTALGEVMAAGSRLSSSS
jgi:hypothetical protein